MGSIKARGVPSKFVLKKYDFDGIAAIGWSKIVCPVWQAGLVVKA